MENKFIHFNSYGAFDTALKNGLIPMTSIVFIDEPRVIWTHGVEYNGEDFNGDLTNIDSRIQAIINEWSTNLTTQVELLQDRMDALLGEDQSVATQEWVLALIQNTTPSTTYTKAEINNLFAGYYTKEQIDNKLASYTPSGSQGKVYNAGQGIIVDNIGNTISLKQASDTEFGGIRTGYTTNGNNYGVRLDSYSGKAYVYVPGGSGNQSGSETARYYEQAFKATNTLDEPALPVNFPNGDDGWGKSAPNTSGTKYVWMCTKLVDTNGNDIDETWNGPWLITGPKGEAGADGTDIEFIYRTNNDPENYPSGYNGTIANAGAAVQDITQDDFVPRNWSDNPTGIDSTDGTCEWVSIRVKKNGVWGPFGTPILWSHWGQNGTDGDGVEYIFWAHKTNTPFEGQYNPVNWAVSQDDEYTGPSNLNPKWEDNPIDLSASNLGPGSREWVSIRKRQNGTWGAFCAPKLWSVYATDGVADGYTVSLTNAYMPICVDGQGQFTTYYNSTKIQAFHNSSPVSFTYRFGTMYMSDNTAPRTNKISVTQDANDQTKINVNIQPFGSDYNFEGKNLYIPVLVTISGTNGLIERECLITVYGVQTGDAGKRIDLRTNTDIINTDYEVSLYAPNKIYPWITIANENTITKEITPVNTVSGDTESRKYKFCFAVNMYTDANRTSISYSNTYTDLTQNYIDLGSNEWGRFKNIASISIQARTVDGNILVDQVVIPVIRDGKPGIDGFTSSDYSIVIVGSDLTGLYTDSNTKTASGTVRFKVLSKQFTGYNNGVPVYDNRFLYRQNNKNYWATALPISNSNSYETTDTLTVTLGGVVLANGTQDSAGVYQYTLSNQNVTSFVGVIELNSSTHLAATAVVPFAVRGAKGETGANGTNANVQAIGNIMRLRSWVSGETYYYKDVDTISGCVTTDVVLYQDGYYRLATEGSRSMSVAPADQDNQVNNGWVDFVWGSDSFYNNLIANQAYIQNVTSKNVIVTNTRNTPVAGMVSTETIPGNTNSPANVSPVRIFAGPFSDGNVNTANFVVREDGSGHAAGGNIEWDENGDITMDYDSITYRSALAYFANTVEITDILYYPIGTLIVADENGDNLSGYEDIPFDLSTKLNTKGVANVDFVIHKNNQINVFGQLVGVPVQDYNTVDASVNVANERDFYIYIMARLYKRYNALYNYGTNVYITSKNVMYQLNSGQDVDDRPTLTPIYFENIAIYKNFVVWGSSELDECVVNIQGGGPAWRGETGRRNLLARQQNNE